MNCAIATSSSNNNRKEGSRCLRLCVFLCIARFQVRGNLTEVLKRVGYGNSYGVGIRLGAVRCEYDVDGNASKGYLQLRFGERF